MIPSFFSLFFSSPNRQYQKTLQKKKRKKKTDKREKKKRTMTTTEETFRFRSVPQAFSVFPSTTEGLSTGFGNSSEIGKETREKTRGAGIRSNSPQVNEGPSLAGSGAVDEAADLEMGAPHIPDPPGCWDTNNCPQVIALRLDQKAHWNPFSDGNITKRSELDARIAKLVAARKKDAEVKAKWEARVVDVLRAHPDLSPTVQIDGALFLVKINETKRKEAASKTTLIQPFTQEVIRRGLCKRTAFAGTKLATDLVAKTYELLPPRSAWELKEHRPKIGRKRKNPAAPKDPPGSRKKAVLSMSL